MSATPLTLVPLTELDAVNQMLLSIGNSPVNSLNVPGVKDVSFAQLTLHNVSRDVQKRGWWFNTDTQYPMLPTSEGKIPLPANALEVVPESPVVDREGFLYDTDKHSFVFPTGVALKVDIKWFQKFEKLPEAARAYIRDRAGRVFQANSVASDILYRFTKEMELESLAELERNHLRVLKPNILTSNVTTNRIHFRR